MPAVARARRAPARAVLSAKSDPRFQKLLAQLKQSSSKVKKHPPAAKKASEAQAAAKGPANEKLAGAKAKQVDKMKEAEGKKPEAGGFLALLRGEIEKVMPKNLDEADKFMKGGEKDQLKGAAGGNVDQQKQDAAGPVQQASGAAPNTAGVPGKESTPIPEEPSPAPAPVDTNNAVPAPKPDAQVTQEQTKKDADQQLKDAEVTPAQLKKANDPRFSAVLTAKSDAEKVADTSPGKYRAGEKVALVQGVAKAAGDARKGLSGIHGTKTRSGAAVKSRQQLAKEKDEAERKKVTDTIEGIYTETKATVENKLASLETDVMARFDRGIDAALAGMQSYANREIDRFKDDRYSGILGKGRWFADLFRPTPEGIKQILRQARTRFIAEMDALAVEVARIVDRRLKEAKDEVARGQKRIDTYVKGLPKNLQALGKDAQAKVAERFKELEQGIDEKANDLAQKLAQKYKEASDKADAALKKLEEENAGALKKLADKIGEIIKILAEFKDKLMAVLKKGWETIKKILADPISFIGNLISALKQGFSQFVDNIWAHLKAGFMKWLFGSLADAGIQIPADLNVWSVLKLVLDVLGLTYAWIRGEAVKLVGERNVTLIEKLIDYIMITIRGGPKALWEKLQEDLSNLKEMVIDAIQTWLIETVVKSAVTKVLSMFNPAGAFVQAIIMIYNVVMWVIENASRILSLIEAVVNSTSAIADGNIGGAANWIENALAAAIPIVIAFLARLIGLGGISGKIREFITKVQARVRGAVLGWLKKAWAWVKKLFGKGGKAGTAEGEGEGEVAEAPVDMKGTSHTLSIDAKGEVSIASAKGKISGKIGSAIKKVNAEKPPEPKQKQRLGALAALRTEAEKIEKKIKKDKVKKKADRKALLDPLVTKIKGYAETYGAKDVEEVLIKEFPGPEVGDYASMAGFASSERSDPERVLPDGTLRIPHHAPPVEFGETLAGPLLQAGNEMEKKAAGSGADLVDAAVKLKANVKGHGATLPTILVHEQTHRSYPKVTGRIHGSEIKATLLARLKAKGLDIEELVTGSTGKDLTVSPGGKAFERQAKRVGKRVTNLSNFTSALKKDAKTVVQTLYGAASAQAMGAVQVALGSSVLDGPAGKRTGAVTRLRNLAKKVWQDSILGSLF